MYKYVMHAGHHAGWEGEKNITDPCVSFKFVSNNVKPVNFCESVKRSDGVPKQVRGQKQVRPFTVLGCVDIYVRPYKITCRHIPHLLSITK